MNPYVTLIAVISLVLIYIAVGGLLGNFVGIDYLASNPATESLLQEVSSLVEEQKYDEALPLAHQALDTSDRLMSFNSKQLAPSLHYLGQIYLNKGDFSMAERYFKRVLDIEERVLPRFSDASALGTNLYWLGVTYFNQSRYPEAAETLVRALALLESSYGKTDPVVGHTTYYLGQAYIQLRRYSEAESAIRRALEIYESTFPEGDYNIGNALYIVDPKFETPV